MILIIAYGNSLRQDDGAGFGLAEQLEELLYERGIAVQRLVGQQLVPELAADIAGEGVTAVVFVDTRVTIPAETAPQIEITPLAARESSPALGHHLDAAALLLYASRLYGQSPPAWLLTVPGTTFGYGETFSLVTCDALNQAATVLKPWLDEHIEHTLKA